jgi:hypothetical protein
MAAGEGICRQVGRHAGQPGATPASQHSSAIRRSRRGAPTQADGLWSEACLVEDAPHRLVRAVPGGPTRAVGHGDKLGESGSSRHRGPQRLFHLRRLGRKNSKERMGRERLDIHVSIHTRDMIKTWVVHKITTREKANLPVTFGLLVSRLAGRNGQGLEALANGSWIVVSVLLMTPQKLVAPSPRRDVRTGARVGVRACPSVVFIRAGFRCTNAVQRADRERSLRSDAAWMRHGAVHARLKAAYIEVRQRASGARPPPGG